MNTEQMREWVETLKTAHDESIDDFGASSRKILRDVISDMEAALTQPPQGATMSQLQHGLIPAGQPCPFRQRCAIVAACRQTGANDYSCAQARAYDLIEQPQQESREMKEQP